jgi:sugar lactone lactonase YvrE
MTSTRRTLTTMFAGLSAATLATGLALAAPTAYAHDGGDDHGGSSGPGPGSGDSGDHSGPGSGGDDQGDDGHHGDARSHVDLPNGFRPEGIATGSRHTAYLGSLADGDIYALDLHSGDGEVISQGPGTPSTGLKVDHHRLFVSGGSGGDARVVDIDSGDVLKSYTLVPAGTPSFINDVIVTEDAAWFTDSMENALYRIPLGDDDHGHHHGHRHGDDGVGHQRHGGHGDHGHHGLPGQADVQKVDLTGDWVQGAGTSANGITTTPDGRALLVVNSSNGLLYRVDEDGVAEQVDLGGYVITNGDGLLREGRTLYAVQNQLNKVAVFRLDERGDSGELRATLTSPDFDVPTTIARSDGDLFLPNARFTTPPTPDTPYWVTGIDG